MAPSLVDKRGRRYEDLEGVQEGALVSGFTQPLASAHAVRDVVPSDATVA